MTASVEQAGREVSQVTFLLVPELCCLCRQNA